MIYAERNSNRRYAALLHSDRLTAGLGAMRILRLLALPYHFDLFGHWQIAEIRDIGPDNFRGAVARDDVTTFAIHFE